MDENEQYVRSVWGLVHQCDGSYRHYSRGTVLVQTTHGQWIDFPTWSHAADFTRQRLEEVRQLQEEIASVNYHIGFMIVTSGPMSYPASWDRIVVRLNKELQMLTRGMMEDKRNE